VDPEVGGSIPPNCTIAFPKQSETPPSHATRLLVRALASGCCPPSPRSHGERVGVRGSRSSSLLSIVCKPPSMSDVAANRFLPHEFAARDLAVAPYPDRFTIRPLPASEARFGSCVPFLLSFLRRGDRVHASRRGRDVSPSPRSYGERVGVRGSNSRALIHQLNRNTSQLTWLRLS